PSTIIGIGRCITGRSCRRGRGGYGGRFRHVYFDWETRCQSRTQQSDDRIDNLAESSFVKRGDGSADRRRVRRKEFTGAGETGDLHGAAGKIAGSQRYGVGITVRIAGDLAQDPVASSSVRQS